MWQGQIAAALAAPSSTPITPSLPLLTALLGPRTAEEAAGYALEAQALADQVPTGEPCHNLPALNSLGNLAGFAQAASNSEMRAVLSVLQVDLLGHFEQARGSEHQDHM